MNFQNYSMLLEEIEDLSNVLMQNNSPTNWKESLKLHSLIADRYKKNKVFPSVFKSPLGIQMELTYKCNLRCIHCYNNSGRINGAELSDLEWLKVAREAANLEIFECILSGGEPFIRKKLVLKIMNIISECKARFVLISNGWFIDKDVLKNIQKYKFRFFQISIDGVSSGVHDKIRRKNGSWEHAVKAAHLIADTGIPLCIAHTLMPENFLGLEKMIDFAFELGAKYIITDEVIFTGAAAANYQLLKMPNGWKKKYFDILKRKQEEYSGYMTIMSAIDPAISLRRSMLEPNKVALMRPNGDVKLDCVTPFVFGNTRNNSLIEIWRGGLDRAWGHPTVQKFIHSIKSNDDLHSNKDFPVPHLEDDIVLS